VVCWYPSSITRAASAQAQAQAGGNSEYRTNDRVQDDTRTCAAVQLPTVPCQQSRPAFEKTCATTGKKR